MYTAELIHTYHGKHRQRVDVHDRHTLAELRVSLKSRFKESPKECSIACSIKSCAHQVQTMANPWLHLQVECMVAAAAATLLLVIVAAVCFLRSALIIKRYLRYICDNIKNVVLVEVMVGSVFLEFAASENRDSFE